MFVFKHRKKDIEVIDNDQQFEITIKKQFHLKNLYKDLHEWLQENEYYDAETGKGDKFETLYWEFMKPGGVTNHHIWWRVLKNPRGTNGKRFRYFMKINFQTLGLKKVETIIDGKKFKLDKGELSMKIKTYVQVDPNEEWKNHPIIKHFENILINRWFKKKIENHKKLAYQDMLAIHRRIKQFLEGHVEVPTVEGWRRNITGL
jgi:hypothetical protein